MKREGHSRECSVSGTVLSLEQIPEMFTKFRMTPGFFSEGYSAEPLRCKLINK